jgi:hypothetical protein
MRLLDKKVSWPICTFQASRRARLFLGSSKRDKEETTYSEPQHTQNVPDFMMNAQQHPQVTLTKPPNAKVGFPPFDRMASSATTMKPLSWQSSNKSR